MAQRLPVASLLTLTVAVAFSSPGLSGQSAPPAPASPVFEVASIKPNKSGDFRRAMGPEPGGRFGALNVGLRELIGFAYGIPNAEAESRILGGPEWIRTERFDVAATTEGAPSPDRLALMMRALLADRFKLKVRHDTREVPVYALVMARANGSLGPQLRRSDVDYDARRADDRGGKPLTRPPGGAVCT